MNTDPHSPFRTMMNLQVPVSFLLLSRDIRTYECWFQFFSGTRTHEHRNFLLHAPSSTICNLFQVILGYTKLIQALLLLCMSINIYKRIKKDTIALDTGTLIILSELNVKGLWNSWMLSIQADMDSDTNPNFTHQEITGNPLQSNSVRGVPRKRAAVFSVYILV